MRVLIKVPGDRADDAQLKQQVRAALAELNEFRALNKVHGNRSFGEFEDAWEQDRLADGTILLDFGDHNSAYQYSGDIRLLAMESGIQTASIWAAGQSMDGERVTSVDIDMLGPDISGSFAATTHDPNMGYEEEFGILCSATARPEFLGEARDAQSLLNEFHEPDFKPSVAFGP